MAVRIADLLPPPVEVTLGIGTVEVRGLALDEIVTLLQQHKEHLLPLFTQKNPDFAAVVAQSPSLVAEIIAIASDTKGQEDDIRRLPFSDQAIAMGRVWQLTVPDVAKLIESLSGVVATLNASVGPINSISKLSSPPLSGLSLPEGTDSPTSASTH